MEASRSGSVVRGRSESESAADIAVVGCRDPRLGRKKGRGVALLLGI